MRTFGDILTEIGRLLGRPDAVYRDHIKAAVNLAIAEYNSEFCTPYNMRRRTILATGEPQQALPQDVDRPVWILDVTHRRGVDPGLQWDRAYPAEFAAGTPGPPYEWQLDGVYPVIRQPGGVHLTFESSASDARVVSLEGLVADTGSSGQPSALYASREQAFLTGTTPVTSGTAYVEITRLAVSSRAGAAVHVRDAASGAILATIEPRDLAPQYTWVRWLLVPPAGTELMMAYLPRPPYLVSDDEALPAHIPPSYLLWAPMAQLATDMGKDGLALLALRKLEKIVRGERARQLAFGDLDNQAIPPGDAWAEDGI